ncbi:MAG: TIGR02147 family protein [Oligoflexus sp.]|nr:TIGR02147 family protein [Oligoflexus sp.]
MSKTVSLIENAVKETKPSSWLDYRLYLKSLYTYCKEAKEGYSYQKFAEDLGFNGTTVMHQIVNGYRPLSAKAGKQVVDCLGLDAREARYFLTLIAFSHAKNAQSREENFQLLQALKRQTLPDEIDRNLLDYFSQWYHPVIWELIGIQGFRPEVAWIAKKIIPNVKPSAVQDSLELLLKLGLIVIDAETKTYRQTKNRVATGHRIKGLALVSYHGSMIDHAKSALTSISGTRRDVSAVTVSVNEETAKKLRDMIHTFQLQLLDEAERAGTGDQVYQINIQLFPFTE